MCSDLWHLKSRSKKRKKKKKKKALPDIVHSNGFHVPIRKGSFRVTYCAERERNGVLETVQWIIFTPPPPQFVSKTYIFECLGLCETADRMKYPEPHL